MKITPLDKLVMDHWREWMYAFESGNSESGPTIEDLKEDGFVFVDGRWTKQESKDNENHRPTKS